VDFMKAERFREEWESHVTAQGTRASVRHEWMSMREASAMIGVSPATLRRWSDAGDIKAFTTPGGHRRFSRAAVVAMLPAERRERPHLGQLGETPQRMTRIYRRELRQASHWAPWVDTIDDADRQALRDHGDRIAGALLEFLDAELPAERAVALATAEDSSGECGRIAGRIGLPIQATMEAFLGFRMPFLRELSGVARRRGLDTAETTALLQTAIEAFDRLLIATVRGHEHAVRTEPTEPAPEAAAR
jgi:excisionase family DNA binding protein